ncbi:Phosphoglycerate mutase family protein [Perilla frutescens var. hirtella]|nr:Phosphoglycerate mutase family protein [Perilla frutescens var. hirtella]KAH6813098.1 Phosphoglycerate mutase family protein [Perilla frutescens var. frutescens]
MGLTDGDGSSKPLQFRQNVVVMRHGDRLDNVVPLWAASAPRPWDPPLADDGRVRAFSTGDKLRKQLGFPIHRVFVSPFLRCLQTAAGVVSALSAVDKKSDDPYDLASNGVVIDPSKIKVSMEYGLSEMMNSLAIRSNVAPKDGVFSFDITQCKSVLPAGTIDNAAEMIYKELPKWQETLEGARARYIQVIKNLADKYPSENLLLVTHGEGVGSAVSSCFDDVVVAEVEYCAYSILKRSVVFSENTSFTAEGFVGSLKDLDGVQLMKAQEA